MYTVNIQFKISAIDAVKIKVSAIDAYSQNKGILLTIVFLSLSPYGGDVQQSLIEGGGGCCHPALVSMIGSSSHLYEQSVTGAILKANQVYEDFISNEEGSGFAGEVLF